MSQGLYFQCPHKCYQLRKISGLYHIYFPRSDISGFAQNIHLPKCGIAFQPQNGRPVTSYIGRLRDFDGYASDSPGVSVCCKLHQKNFSFHLTFDDVISMPYVNFYYFSLL